MIEGLSYSRVSKIFKFSEIFNLQIPIMEEEYPCQKLVGLKHNKSFVFVGFTSPKPIKALNFFVVSIDFRRYLNVKYRQKLRSKFRTSKTDNNYDNRQFLH